MRTMVSSLLKHDDGSMDSPLLECGQGLLGDAVHGIRGVQR